MAGKEPAWVRKARRKSLRIRDLLVHEEKAADESTTESSSNPATTASPTSTTAASASSSSSGVKPTTTTSPAGDRAGSWARRGRARTMAFKQSPVASKSSGSGMSLGNEEPEWLKKAKARKTKFALIAEEVADQPDPQAKPKPEPEPKPQDKAQEAKPSSAEAPPLRKARPTNPKKLNRRRSFTFGKTHGVTKKTSGVTTDTGEPEWLRKLREKRSKGSTAKLARAKGDDQEGTPQKPSWLDKANSKSQSMRKLIEITEGPAEETPTPPSASSSSSTTSTPSSSSSSSSTPSSTAPAVAVKSTEDPSPIAASATSSNPEDEAAASVTSSNPEDEAAASVTSSNPEDEAAALDEAAEGEELIPVCWQCESPWVLEDGEFAPRFCWKCGAKQVFPEDEEEEQPTATPTLQEVQPVKVSPVEKALTALPLDLNTLKEGNAAGGDEGDDVSAEINMKVISPRELTLDPEALEVKELSPRSLTPAPATRAKEPAELQPLSLEPAELQPLSLEPTMLEPTMLEPTPLEPTMLEPASLDVEELPPPTIPETQPVSSSAERVEAAPVSPRKVAFAVEGGDSDASPASAPDGDDDAAAAEPDTAEPVVPKEAGGKKKADKKKADKKPGRLRRMLSKLGKRGKRSASSKNLSGDLAVPAGSSATTKQPTFVTPSFLVDQEDSSPAAQPAQEQDPQALEEAEAEAEARAPRGRFMSMPPAVLRPSFTSTSPAADPLSASPSSSSSAPPPSASGDEEAEPVSEPQQAAASSTSSPEPAANPLATSASAGKAEAPHEAVGESVTAEAGEEEEVDGFGLLRSGSFRVPAVGGSAGGGGGAPGAGGAEGGFLMRSHPVVVSESAASTRTVTSAPDRRKKGRRVELRATLDNTTLAQSGFAMVSFRVSVPKGSKMRVTSMSVLITDDTGFMKGNYPNLVQAQCPEALPVEPGTTSEGRLAVEVPQGEPGTKWSLQLRCSGKGLTSSEGSTAGLGVNWEVTLCNPGQQFLSNPTQLFAVPMDELRKRVGGSPDSPLPPAPVSEAMSLLLPPGSSPQKLATNLLAPMLTGPAEVQALGTPKCRWTRSLYDAGKRPKAAGSADAPSVVAAFLLFLRTLPFSLIGAEHYARSMELGRLSRGASVAAPASGAAAGNGASAGSDGEQGIVRPGRAWDWAGIIQQQHPMRKALVRPVAQVLHLLFDAAAWMPMDDIPSRFRKVFFCQQQREEEDVEEEEEEGPDAQRVVDEQVLATGDLLRLWPHITWAIAHPDQRPQEEAAQQPPAAEQQRDDEEQEVRLAAVLEPVDLPDVSPATPSIASAAAAAAAAAAAVEELGVDGEVEELPFLDVQLDFDLAAKSDAAVADKHDEAPEPEPAASADQESSRATTTGDLEELDGILDEPIVLQLASEPDAKDKEQPDAEDTPFSLDDDEEEELDLELKLEEEEAEAAQEESSPATGTPSTPVLDAMDALMQDMEGDLGEEGEDDDAAGDGGEMELGLEDFGLDMEALDAVGLQVDLDDLDSQPLPVLTPSEPLPRGSFEVGFEDYA